jgi:hypothetical protein
MLNILHAEHKTGWIYHRLDIPQAGHTTGWTDNRLKRSKSNCRRSKQPGTVSTLYLSEYSSEIADIFELYCKLLSWLFAERRLFSSSKTIVKSGRVDLGNTNLTEGFYFIIDLRATRWSQRGFSPWGHIGMKKSISRQISSHIGSCFKVLIGGPRGLF